MAGEDRSEAPTGKRRAEARRKGQVGRSAEITSVAVLFVSLYMLANRGPEILSLYKSIAREAFTQVAWRQDRPDALLSLTGTMLLSSAAVIAPIVLMIMLTGVAVNLVQVGPGFSMEVVSPNLSKLNPIPGMQRLFSPKALVEVVKSIVKLGVTGFVAYQVIMANVPNLVALQAASPEGALIHLGGIIMEIGQKCGLALVIMAIADYIYQKRSFENSLKMTKQEVKEEAKAAEGNPQVKGKIKQLQRQYALRRMMQSVPQADVVVTNPTHYAVAIEYKSKRNQAPLVTAKGQNLVAQNIKRVAREHGVPVLENPPLARALYRSVEIGDAIPPAMYQAVAEVLAFIYRLKGTDPDSA
ncbi:MAG TPA: flagellar biosynthesis protein FlhB [Chloroflexota bacterium]|nr:flagellar biosynthesis protein FlhB [Chloroflexota bacterium]